MSQWCLMEIRRQISRIDKPVIRFTVSSSNICESISLMKSLTSSFLCSSLRFETTWNRSCLRQATLELPSKRTSRASASFSFVASWRMFLFHSFVYVLVNLKAEGSKMFRKNGSFTLSKTSCGNFRWHSDWSWNRRWIRKEIPKVFSVKRWVSEDREKTLRHCFGLTGAHHLHLATYMFRWQHQEDFEGF